MEDFQGKVNGDVQVNETKGGKRNDFANKSKKNLTIQILKSHGLGWKDTAIVKRLSQDVRGLGI